MHRYAAYYAPAPQSAWWRAGSSWLGRCAIQDAPRPQPAVPGVTEGELQRLTAAPRRYGWHATLRAPFALASGVQPDALRARLRDICRAQQPFTLPSLKVVVMDGFLALVPACGETGAIDAVARACVTGLQQLAAPPAPRELQRRLAAGLSDQELALLRRWGYPYVMDRFRFHFSLTGPLHDAPDAVVRALHEAAVTWFGILPACRFESVALFAEPEEGADFVLLEHVPLGAGQPQEAGLQCGRSSAGGSGMTGRA